MQQRRLIMPLIIFWSLSAVALLLWVVLGKGTVEVAFDTVTVKAEVADNPEVRSQGLSDRAELKAGEGMLFVFEEPDYYPFHMRNMNFALDLIWMDESFEVVDITRRAHPDTYPSSFTPSVPAQYVLEVPAGFAREYDITEGDQAAVSGL